MTGNRGGWRDSVPVRIGDCAADFTAMAQVIPP